MTILLPNKPEMQENNHYERYSYSLHRDNSSPGIFVYNIIVYTLRDFYKKKIYSCTISQFPVCVNRIFYYVCNIFVLYSKFNTISPHKTSIHSNGRRIIRKKNVNIQYQSYRLHTNKHCVLSTPKRCV